MADHSSILAYRIPWTEEPGWPQSMGSESETAEVTQHAHMCVCVCLCVCVCVTKLEIKQFINLVCSAIHQNIYSIVHLQLAHFLKHAEFVVQQKTPHKKGILRLSFFY